MEKETECFVLDQKNDHVLYSFQSNRKESEIKTLLRQTNNLQGGLYCKLWDSEKYGIKVLIVSKNTGLIHSLMSTFTWGIFLLFSLITIMILAQKIIIQRTTEPEKEITLPALNMAALLMVPVVSIVYIYYLIIVAHEIKEIVIFAALALLFINILIFYLYHSLLKFYSARMNEQVFKQMLEVYSYQLDIARESEERVKALRHDIKHHIIELSAMD